MGRAYIDAFDYSDALKDHYDASTAAANMKQVHEWMEAMDRDDSPSEREARGYDSAYDCRVWPSYPGDRPTMMGVILQNVTGGLLGSGGGRTQSSIDYTAKLVHAVGDS